MKPWFRYATLGGMPLVWWPCHWKGVLLMIGAWWR